MKQIKLFETIRILDGIPQHLDYHNHRLNQSRKRLFGINTPTDITDHLTNLPQKGLYRAKLIYGENIEKPNYYIYKARKIEKLVPVVSHIDYDHKYLDRSEIGLLVAKASLRNAQRADTQVCPYDIVIIKEGLLTDTSIANIAFRQNGIWYTPAKPLLKGTTRARLIKEGKIIPRNIHYIECKHYDAIALMNAMIGFRPIQQSPQSLISNSKGSALMNAMIGLQKSASCRSLPEENACR